MKNIKLISNGDLTDQGTVIDNKSILIKHIGLDMIAGCDQAELTIEYTDLSFKEYIKKAKIKNIELEFEIE